ncbi:predicted protein [Naegleria gruberi]|uniref:Predicted protein n=1 Tax=Naegleria gruberi TaxID=5762 RepID=D2VZ57_NAEGR|nr:uncharacterized protein NAEGRDRAFT_53417 [Naegleria gruberi]EFC37934.1 predicted protein [Naegleria gruberi]|eukprot:XP_002670678.1 predicted protein [Naegleria gruberi strain NEG-M]
MKDPKRRILQEFIKLFADEKLSSSSSSIHSSSCNDQNDHGRIILDDKIDNYYDGYRGVFMNILTYLDEFDLALSIQPTCKLFEKFSRSDDLWEKLMHYRYDSGCMIKFNTSTWEDFKKRLELSNNFKESFVDSWRTFYKMRFALFSSSKYVFHEPIPVEKRRKRFHNCENCKEGIDDDEPFIELTGLGKRKALHLGCVDKEDFRKRYPHVLTFITGNSGYKQDIIDTLYRSKMFGDVHGSSLSGKHSEDEDELEDEEELPEFSCDICEEPIHGIRYNCLDCDEYDLCGYCCEKVIMKQKGSTLKMCENADHPHDHTFQSVGEEEFGTYSCNKCMDKVRGFRYHKLDENDYDLCSLCFFATDEKDLFERIDLFGEKPVEELYTTFCEQLLLNELKTVMENISIVHAANTTKKELSSTLISILEERKEKNNRPSICNLVSNVERFCCKGEDGTVLPNSAPNSIVYSVELVDDVKPPKKKTKLA